jgi:hypothetical protein
MKWAVSSLCDFESESCIDADWSSQLAGVAGSCSIPVMVFDPDGILHANLLEHHIY